MIDCYVKKSGIYIHIPFCVSKCNYCAFLSEEVGFNGDIAVNEKINRYIDALCAEIRSRGSIFAEHHKDYDFNSEVCDTIYFGGGTPSLLEPIQVEKIISAVYDSFAFAGNPEITLEANPATITENKLAGYKSLGITRLSIGVQSFNDKVLKRLGRIHCARDIIDDYDLARKIGFDNISMDLIFASPDTNLNDVKCDIKVMSDLQPEHISFYSLQIEEGTPFFEQMEADILNEVPDCVEREMYHIGCELLETAGYEHYEISNFARGRSVSDSPYRSKHNSKYWNMNEYIGLGIGASSYEMCGCSSSRCDDATQYMYSLNAMKSAWEIADYAAYPSLYRRTVNCADLKQYLENAISGESQFEEIHLNTIRDNIEEAVFTGLRRREGIRYSDIKDLVCADKRCDPRIWFRSIYGKIWDELDDFEKSGYLEIDSDGLRLTSKGIDISNRIMMLFL